MPDVRELRIIVPACNEAGRLEDTLRDYCSTFTGKAVVLVVANGCADGTSAVVNRLRGAFANLCLLEIPARIGKGGAVRAGFATASEPFVGFVDADGSTSALEFARLYSLLVQSESDAIIGSRWLPGAIVKPRQPLKRRFASRCFNVLARMILGLRFSDTQCGAKIFRRSAVTDVLSSLELAGFAFDIEVLWRLQRRNFVIREVPTVWSDRLAGTKIRLVHAAWTMLGSVIRLRLRDSFLWGVPFVDWVGRSTAIPVRQGYCVLLLGAARADGNAELAQFLDGLRRHGLTILDERTAFGASRLRVVLGYVFARHRYYDALIEIASRKPAWIPAFSAKPTVVVYPSDTVIDVSKAYVTVYRRSSLVWLARMAPVEAAAYTASIARRTDPYPGVFVDEGPSALTLKVSNVTQPYTVTSENRV